jgi:hypothetical protein
LSRQAGVGTVACEWGRLGFIGFAIGAILGAAVLAAAAVGLILMWAGATIPG